MILAVKAYIAMGSNQGNSVSFLSNAVHFIRHLVGVKLLGVSSLYVTQAVGGPPQADYLNGVLMVQTSFAPQQLMLKLLDIERKLGRVRRTKWGPRSIDLDLLAVGQRVVRSRALLLPHPRYHLRRFVLVPFCDVAPRFVHPVLGLQNRTLLRKLTPLGQRVTIFALWNGTQFLPCNLKRKPKAL
ncbi:MAG: Bifunctional folate synthesis protein [Elusimicrobia bacterium]|nr:Bifunctional folate synthesis protein [Elusimicrobiota bacterium]